VDGVPIPRDSAITTAGARLFFSPGWTLAAKFDGDFVSGYRTYAGTGSMVPFSAKNLGLKVLQVELPIQGPVVIVTMKHRTLSPVAKFFIETARAMTRSLD
jgi:hypothetical protein